MSLTCQSSTDIIAFGELLWDCLPSGPVIGGAPCNFTFRIQQMGFACHLVSKVGNDDLGHRLLDELTSRAMDISGVQIDNYHPTGTVPIEISASGNANYTITPNVAFDFIDCNEKLLSKVAEASGFYYGSLNSRTEHSRATLAKLLDACSEECIKILDINLRKDCWDLDVLNFLISKADILKLNDEEAQTLWKKWKIENSFNFPSFAKHVINCFDLKVCVITKGAAGVFASNNEGVIVDLLGQQAKVVDTIGAGDAFAAAFLAGVLRNCSLEQSCKDGTILGAKVAETQGGMAPIK